MIRSGAYSVTLSDGTVVVTVNGRLVYDKEFVSIGPSIFGSGFVVSAVQTTDYTREIKQGEII
jgi:hypothetical protein